MPQIKVLLAQRVHNQENEPILNFLPISTVLHMHPNISKAFVPQQSQISLEFKWKTLHRPACVMPDGAKRTNPCPYVVNLLFSPESLISVGFK